MDENRRASEGNQRGLEATSDGCEQNHASNKGPIQPYLKLADRSAVVSSGPARVMPGQSRPTSDKREGWGRALPGNPPDASSFNRWSPLPDSRSSARGDGTVGLPWADRAFAGLLRHRVLRQHHHAWGHRVCSLSPVAKETGLPLVMVWLVGCAGGPRPSSPRPEIRGTPDIGRGAPARPRWCDQIPTPGGKSALSLFGTQLCPPPFARLREAIGDWGRQTKTRSCYEYHPPGCSKTVRTAVGRSIFPASGIGRTSKPAAGE